MRAAAAALRCRARTCSSAWRSPPLSRCRRARRHVQRRRQRGRRRNGRGRREGARGGEAAGGTFVPRPADGRGQHMSDPNQRVTYETFPASSGIHNPTTSIWGNYRNPGRPAPGRPQPRARRRRHLVRPGHLRRRPRRARHVLRRGRERPHHHADPRSVSGRDVPEARQARQQDRAHARGPRRGRPGTARSTSRRSRSSTSRHSRRSGTRSAARARSASPSARCCPEATKLSAPGWRNWSYAPDLKSGVPLGGVRVRLPPRHQSPGNLTISRRGVSP